MCMTDTPYYMCTGCLWCCSRTAMLSFKALVTISVLPLVLLLVGSTQHPEWVTHGGDLANRRFADYEHELSVKTAPRLTQKWRFVAGADVSATPAIYEGTVFFPSWNGNLYAVSIEGICIWEVNLTRITAIDGALSRTTPAITNEIVLVGILGPATVVALRRETGALVWISEVLDETPLARITMSGTAFKGAFYVGISSLQELVEETCCNFQGSFQKLDLKTGKRIWRTLMIPDNNGMQGQYSGVAVWGSSPSIDEKRGLVYIATGNLYTVPPDVQACLDENPNSTNCIPPNVCDDAVVAINMADGSICWCNRLGGNDIWRLACQGNAPPPNCPAEAGPDYDFGEAPMLLTIPWHKKELRDIVVTGQKSGFIWAHDRSTGELVWETVAGPGGEGGGAIWGSATDNVRVYTNIANSNMLPFTLAPSDEVTTGGGWAAMDARTGTVLWSTANPTGARASGPVTIANGVLLVGSFDPKGHVCALNAYNGKILWCSTTNATVYGGFSVGYGCAFIGSGYALAPLGPAFGGTPGDSLYCFCV